MREVAERTRAQGEAARLQAIAAADLPPLRDEEARAGAALHRLVLARDALAGEEKRAKERVAELERRIAQLAQDLQREEALIADAAHVMARLTAEDETLAAEAAKSEDAKREAEERRARLEQRLAERRSRSGRGSGRLRRTSTRGATRSARGSPRRRAVSPVSRANAPRSSGSAPRCRAPARTTRRSAPRARRSRRSARRSAEAEAEALAAEAAHVEAREAEARSRGPLAEAERAAQRLDTEARTLTKLLGSASGGPWPPVVDAVNVARGYEAALGAALGDDLEASTGRRGARALVARRGRATAIPNCRPASKPLASRVEAPPALRRRLAQIGVVARAEGKRLAATLRPGQRLVSKEGDLWRWDGFVSTAEAPTPAARRLVEKNRLGDLSREAEAARQAAEVVRAASGARAGRAARSGERRKRGPPARARGAKRLRRGARQTRGDGAASRADAFAPLRVRRGAGARADVARRGGRAQGALRGRAQGLWRRATNWLWPWSARARGAAQERAEFAEAKAAAQTLAREAELARRGDARSRSSEAPGSSGGRRRRPISPRSPSGASPRKANSNRSPTRRSFSCAAPRVDRASRRGRGGAQGRGRRARRRRDRARRGRPRRARRARGDGLGARSARRLGRKRSRARAKGGRRCCAPSRRSWTSSRQGLAALAGLASGAAPPEAGLVERKLESLRQERERLGAVNLRADEELAEVAASRERLIAERDDLTEAIKRLRHAIHNLNQEGRERLLAAFDVVNKHFGELFATLFEGGTAELQLIESDDPLEAGLELLARPPGKKPQTLTLLSGGEQALTAMALIFAVFLTNPSPICVLDEVDAPLDDYNVERFCDLLDEMRKRADTRFVTITHNPITMARMDRLFGVTMAERGVSQIVSVDLATAEQFLEAS